MNGLLLVDKPTGVTSHDVVHKARRLLGMQGVGHAGTLDPLASGLLILLVGEGTKVSDYLLNGDKGYECKVKLGIATDSMDMTGEVLNESAVEVDFNQIRSAALSLQGEIQLEVPVHSAVKVDGQRLYKLAHKGERPESVPARMMKFYDLEVCDLQVDSILVQMKCSKGSFVRAWAHYLGQKLGCGGAVESLRRHFSAPFHLRDALTLEQLESLWQEKDKRHGEIFGKAWIPLKDSLPHFRRLDISGHDEKLLRNGQISKGLQAQLLQFVTHGEALPPVRVVSRESDDLAAILLAEPGRFYKIKRVFHRA